MSARKTPTKNTDENGETEEKINTSVSLPVFQVVSEQDSPAQYSIYSDIKTPRKVKRAKSPKVMEETTTVAQIHQTPVKVHQSNRKSKSQSKHEHHKCHKNKSKSSDPLPPHVTTQALLDKIEKLKYENYILNKKLNVSVSSVDSGLSQNELLPPFEVDLNNAYQHVKKENNKLTDELKALKAEYNDMTVYIEKLHNSNKSLSEDVLMLKNLVYKLNIELERYQSGESESHSTGEKKVDILPDNYNKNFLRPILPLLKAYSETIHEKNELIEDFENDLKKFHTSFNEVLKENEKLYKELEKKANSDSGAIIEELRALKKELDIAKQENQILSSQIDLEKQKLLEVHSVYRVKVADVWKQKENVNESLQEHKADLYMMKGKYSVLKQEFERLKLDNDSRIPLVVHSASIAECKRLFQDLKNEYEAEKQHLTSKLKEQEGILMKMKKQSEDWTKEKSQFERANFDLTFENETLARRITELETRLTEEGRDPNPEKDRSELNDTKKLLRESNRKVEELSNKLLTTKKQLHKAMSFAEDIVREQEVLLIQLHTKQKENNYMATQFGSLKSQLRSVEKGAHEGLNSIEEKMKNLETENSQLLLEVKRLKMTLREKEDIIKQLEPTRDSTS